MKITAILALALFLVAGAQAVTTDSPPRQDMPASQVLAYGQDTVCKLGCWG